MFRYSFSGIDDCDVLHDDRRELAISERLAGLALTVGLSGVTERNAAEWMRRLRAVGGCEFYDPVSAHFDVLGFVDVARRVGLVTNNVSVSRKVFDNYVNGKDV